jgi:diguanylate cyclase (GGDEF)-like protein
VERLPVALSFGQITIRHAFSLAEAGTTPRRPRAKAEDSVMGFVVDLPTFFAVTVFATSVSGLLLIFAWVTDRHNPALALWAIGYAVSAIAIALIFARGQISDFWSVYIAGAALIAAYGLVWMGARSFNNRATPILYVFAGAIVWLLAIQVENLRSSEPARIVFASSVILCYTLLTGFEFWRTFDQKLSSRWPLILIVGVHAGIFLSRIIWPGWMLIVLSGAHPAGLVVTLISFEIVFHTFCAAFFLASVVKERMVLSYRRASRVDPLTNIWNRRAFSEDASRLLGRAAADKKEVALMAFDLDHFKAINDDHGHAAGDVVLRTFCDFVSNTLRPADLFGRIGGEEFACFLSDVSRSNALATADRLRRGFADLDIDTGSSRLRATVSVGVTVVRPERPDLNALVSMADQALYRAKRLGRNRVEFATSMPLDTNILRLPRRA